MPVERSPVAFRGQPIVVQLYNQATGEEAVKLSPAVQKWVKEKAKKLGWSNVYFPEDYPTKNRAGAVFLK